MKKLYLLIFATVLLTACSTRPQPQSPEECLAQMISQYKEELICKQEGLWQVDLFSATYNEETIYFPMLVCPNCDSTAPTYGYNCASQKVKIEDFTQVTALKKVYDSCTDELVAE